MNILMLFPKYPEDTVYNLNRASRVFTGRPAAVAPLGFLSIAGYLPEDFSVRLIDRNLAEETQEDWEWADVVFFSLMLIQRDDYLACVEKAKHYGKPFAVGGAFTHSMPERLVAEADWVCFGEAEPVMEEFVRDLRAGRRGRRYRGGAETDMRQVRPPRYDLLRNINDYYVIPVQFSRGCPYKCEFCDIIEIYGRVQRAKAPEQVLGELTEIRDLGFEGSIFLVDDNFIGNRRRAREMLDYLADWNQANGTPFFYCTEASLDLANDEALLNAFSRANFTFVFVGIETTDPRLLKSINKLQNIPGGILEKLGKIRQHGIHIVASVIVGFDGEEQDVFEIQRSFIQASGIGIMIVCLLQALPRTQLSRRLKAEGRLLESQDVHLNVTLEGMNFIPKGVMTKRQYLERFADLVSELYRPEVFFERMLPGVLAIRNKIRPSTKAQHILALLRQVYQFGFREKGMRRIYWRSLSQVVRKNPAALGAFFYDCFHYYHLKDNSRYVKEAIHRYLAHPSPGDVLDEVLSVSLDKAAS